ncbi:DUF5629 family protein [Pseudomonas sp. S75]|uniref:DUF5629 family protein n=1 Tax=unclassified Pseudomonas TaxID=196821 RepID=UPI001904B42D|nr:MULTISPECIES: DUF5629 family protein [unclassified Pseudomonas]MBJ9977726.1 DUF5629 family protein [Pseudomonas sp. S30]MBK0155293.1 DUF5629 family protein [Pseudomonas sp. S75]
MSTLNAALQSTDMLLIDGLHAFEFEVEAGSLVIQCMDGRQLRRWCFSAEQVAAARAEGNDWLIDDAEAEHRLVLMSALRAPEEDEDEPHLQAPADR